MIERLRECFTEDFTTWLLRSNNPKIMKDLDYDSYKDLPDDNIMVRAIQLIEKESLEEILSIILREPLADYFWYTYPENSSRLIYSLPSDEVVPSDSLRVDSDKVKAFLRDIKIDKILN